VFIHPASVNFTCGSFPSGFLVYTDIVETSKARRAAHLNCIRAPRSGSRHVPA